MGRMPKAVREEKAEKALALSCKGKTYSAISRELEVTRNTVGTLIDHALSKRDIDEDDEREKSLAHHREIIRWCWEQLETEELGRNAQNRPAYINRIQHSQGEIDRLNHVSPISSPGDVNITVNVEDARRKEEERRQKYERLHEQLNAYRVGYDEGNQGRTGDVRLDTSCPDYPPTEVSEPPS